MQCVTRRLNMFHLLKIQQKSAGFLSEKVLKGTWHRIMMIFISHLHTTISNTAKIDIGHV